MPYTDPSGKEVTLPGSLGEQNLAANRLGYNWVPPVADVTAPPVVANAGTPANMSIGAANQAKGLNPDGTPITDVQKAAEALAAKTSTGVATTAAGTGSVISTSAPEVATENITKAAVDSLNATNPDTVAAHNEALKVLNDQATALEARRAAAVSGINAGFDVTKAKTEAAQKSETGTFGSTLARIGGYLGESASASGAMVNLANTHAFQLQSLEGQRQQAITDANNAINDKQFAIAASKVQEAKDYAKEIADSKQKFFDNSMKILSEDRAQKTYESQSVGNLMDAFTKGNINPIDVPKATSDRIDAFYGIPGFTISSIKTANALAAAKSAKEIADANKSMVDLLQKIPAGQKVTLNGKDYIGIGDSADIATFMETNNQGQATLVTYDKANNKVSTKNLGTIGKTSSATGSAGEKATAVIATMSDAFSGKKLTPDGKPVVDGAGHILPDPWTQAITDAPKLGLSREQFITAFGSRVDTSLPDWQKVYKLTPVEQKLITGVIQ